MGGKTEEGEKGGKLGVIAGFGIWRGLGVRGEGGREGGRETRGG